MYDDARGRPVIGMSRWLSPLGAVLSMDQDLFEDFRAVWVTTGVNLVIALTAVALAVVASLSMTRSIADHLVISVWTVRTHVRNTQSKVHVANRTQAALYDLREGIAGPDDVANS
ncbi:MAG: LuxR C-terminal-related transcriptional regulator [Anaerolineae bacterium]